MLRADGLLCLDRRVTAERYRNLLESAAAAHFSILRINGDAVR